MGENVSMIFIDLFFIFAITDYFSRTKKIEFNRTCKFLSPGRCWSERMCIRHLIYRKFLSTTAGGMNRVLTSKLLEGGSGSLSLFLVFSPPPTPLIGKAGHPAHQSTIVVAVGWPSFPSSPYPSFRPLTTMKYFKYHCLFLFISIFFYCVADPAYRHLFANVCHPLYLMITIWLALRARRSPPGPSDLSIAGYLFHMDADYHIKLTKLADEHGPVYQIHLGSEATVVLSDYALIKDAFGKSVFAGRPNTQLKKLMQGYGNYAPQQSFCFSHSF